MLNTQNQNIEWDTLKGLLLMMSQIATFIRGRARSKWWCRLQIHWSRCNTGSGRKRPSCRPEMLEQNKITFFVYYWGHCFVEVEGCKAMSLNRWASDLFWWASNPVNLPRFSALVLNKGEQKNDFYFLWWEIFAYELVAI